MAHMPAREYFDAHYAADRAVFTGDPLCNGSLAKSLRPDASERFKGITEFVVCLFELNVLARVISRRYVEAHIPWQHFSAPLIYPHQIGIGGRAKLLTNSILRFAQDPGEDAEADPVTLTWPLLEDYTTFFLEDYMGRFMASDARLRILRSEFIKAVADDEECVPLVKAGNRWEPRPIARLLRTPSLLLAKPNKNGVRKPRRERHWIPATPEERAAIKKSLRSAEATRSLADAGVFARIDRWDMGRSDDSKKQLALELAQYNQPLRLNDPHWQEAISIAAKGNDHDFFRRLGRLLKAGPPGDHLQSFLLEHWAKSRDGLPEFFYLSFPDLVWVWRRHLDPLRSEKREGLKTGSMEKACPRLGLKPLRRRMQGNVRLTLEEKAGPGGKPRFRRPDGWFYP